MVVTPTGIKQNQQVEIITAASVADLQTAVNTFLDTLNADPDHNYFTYVSAASEISSPDAPYTAYTLVIQYSYVDITIAGI